MFKVSLTEECSQNLLKIDTSQFGGKKEDDFLTNIIIHA